jgi:hypothetical protein
MNISTRVATPYMCTSARTHNAVGEDALGLHKQREDVLRQQRDTDVRVGQQPQACRGEGTKGWGMSSGQRGLCYAWCK